MHRVPESFPSTSCTGTGDPVCIITDLLRCSRLAPDERKLECRKGPEHATLPTETNLAAHKFTTHRNVLHEIYFKKRKTYITFCM